MNTFKHNITYYYDDEFGTFNYSTSHPMKPLRVAITDDLVGHYGLKKYMNCIVFNIILKLGLRFCNLIHQKSR